MPLLRQLLSFATVGVFATLAHVATAWLLIEGAGFDKYLANALGAAAAFAVSSLGNARFTFATDRSLVRCAGRYLGVTLVSLVLTSAIVAFVDRYGLPTWLYVVIVLATVPPVTFLLAKLWAFQPLRRVPQPTRP